MKEIYENEIEDINKQISVVQRLNDVNKDLRKYNWIFLHPYCQVLEINKLKRIVEEKTSAEENILKHFAESFLELRSTIHFLDGFFATRPFLKDYKKSIDQSVVLCLQKDFNGAINTLIPVIEGTLRKILISKKGDHKIGEINISELLKVFNYLSEDYVQLQREFLDNRFKDSINSLDANQIKNILKKHKEYFDLWANQLVEYLTDNLYANTKNSEVKDSFNRHIIFHSLSDETNYSFANYLRLFNCIQLLSWLIGVTRRECSILSDADEKDVINKWVDYFNILIVSESLTATKRNIYGDASLMEFKEYLHPEIAKLLAGPKVKIDKILKTYNSLLSN